MAKRDPKLARSRLEALLSMASGAVAEPVAGLAGLLGAVTGGAGRGTRAIEATRNALTYQPRDPRGMQEIAAAVAPIASRIEQGKRYLGDSAYNATGSPALAAAAYTAPEGLAALVGLRGAGMKGPTMTQMAERSAGPTMGAPQGQFGAIGAWHGSPYDFDQFSLDKIGTGEGAQAYGHGLYFAGNKDVAEGYRKALSTPQVKVDGAHIDPYSDTSMAGHYINKHGDPDSALAALRSLIAQESSPAVSGSMQRWADEIEKIRGKQIEVAHDGRLYEVELAPDESDLLDWDAPLSQQPEKVRATLAQLVKPAPANWYGREKPADTKWARYSGPSGVMVRENLSPQGDVINYQIGRETGGWDDTKMMGDFATLDEAKRAAEALALDLDGMSGGRIYSELGEPAAASDLLRQHGIPGMRYLDGGSRAAGDGSRNYVMFDDSLVKIKGKE